MVLSGSVNSLKRLKGEKVKGRLLEVEAESKVRESVFKFMSINWAFDRY